MESGAPAVPLARADIHGFRSLPDLNINKLMDEASLRWFRPNEVYAILSNYTHFKIQPQPVETPASGTVLLFDRKMLRNFRKDGHNWKKKKDGKTVQEAHEKLKIGNEERIHVYYARSENDPSFYRRCYWLLDKDLERIVLVHYRHTSEDNAVQLVPVDNVHSSSPLTPVNSTSGSTHSDLSGSAVLSEEINSGELANYTGEECAQLQNHELSLHEINTLEWADLVDISTDTDRTVQRADEISSPGRQKQYELRNAVNDSSLLPSLGLSSSGHPAEIFSDNSLAAVKQMPPGCLEMLEGRENTSSALDYVNSDSQTAGFKSNPVGSDGTAEIFANDIFARQNSFGQWNCLGDDPLDSLNDLNASMSHDDKCDPVITNQEQIFDIIDVSPLWAFSTEQTKVLVIGHFYESHKHIIGSNIYCAFGEICVAAEMVQEGVYHCTALPQTPGMVNFFLTLDGHTPISQVLSFEYRSMPTIASGDGLTSSEDDNDWSKSKKLQTQIRLAHLLFSATNNISNLSSKIQLKYLQEAKRFALLTSPFIEKDWMNLLKLGSDTEISHRPGSEDLLELSLRSKVQEWLLGKIAEGCRTTPLDAQGQGVIHLCAILDYTWAVRLFSLSGLALDFRDAFGWTALHWAAYYGREKMVANLLSAGSNPSLVTDPTSENPGGCTAADLASKGGYEGLSAYLAEKGLAAHFRAMSLAGNITAPPPSTTNNLVNSDNLSSENLSEQELCLKESLAAYRNAADAADRIQAAFRERSLKLQTQAVQLAKPEMEASQIIAALKIQHAFRNHSRRRDMKAAARIQSHFRTWQARRNFLNMRKHAIRIQAVFRGHQIRRQYKKIIWSVGVLEKAVLRWRLKRKGLRGIQTEAPGPMKMDEEEEVSIVEEDFFQISRHQAEERVQRSVVRVQAMFRSYQAQQEYRRMKLAHEQAKLEFSMDDAVDFQ